jgi:hypothetical protein
MAKIEKPQSPVWKNAQRYRARFFDSRFPICGTHLVYVVEGRKWARISQGDLVSDNNRSALVRFRMNIKEWEKLPSKEKYDDRAVATMASNSSND